MAWSNLTADTGATDTTHAHTGLNVETTRHYRVSAINSAGTGKSSSIATGITAPATVPERAKWVDCDKGRRKADRPVLDSPSMTTAATEHHWLPH